MTRILTIACGPLLIVASGGSWLFVGCSGNWTPAADDGADASEVTFGDIGGDVADTRFEVGLPDLDGAPEAGPDAAPDGLAGDVPDEGPGGISDAIADPGPDDEAASEAIDTAVEADAPLPFCGDGRCDPGEACPACPDCACPERCGADLFFSEYLEGTGWNKALEVANFTGRPVDLAGYAIWKITNGGDWSEARALPLSGTLAPEAALVLCHADSAAEILAACDVPVSVDALAFNGDDALALVRNGALIDVIGTDGADPGKGWAVAGVADATFDHTLRRSRDTVDGAATWAEAEPSWEVQGLDVASDLGRFQVAATCAPAAAPRAALNEIDARSDDADFIEIAVYPDAAPLDLGGWVVASTAGRYTFPAGSAAPGGFLALSQGVLGFGLGLVDIVWLYDSGGALQDVVAWNADDLAQGASYGRLPDLTGAFAGNSVATPGAPNQNPASWCGDGVCQPDEDCSSCSGDCLACHPGAGDLVVSEVMASPSSGPEWFEVTSVAGVPLELSGLVLSDDAADFHVVSPGQSWVVAPGAIVVFASGAFGGEDYVFGGMALDAAGDALVLEGERGVVDRVAWSASTAGVALSLSATHLDALDNDAGTAWCDAVDLMPDGQRGTPGAPNPACPECGDHACSAGEDCTRCPGDCGACPIPGCASDLFFSEYLEGSSFTKAIEIANFTGRPVDLSHYAIWRITNGGSTWDALTQASRVALGGTLAHGDVWVGCNTSSAPELIARCDALYGQASAPTNFNGDDALALAKDGVLIDVIGEEAVDPGVGWTVAGVPDATFDHGLVRAPSAMHGDLDWARSASGEWQVLGVDDFTGIGAHVVDYTCAP